MKLIDLSSGAAHFFSPAAAVENTISALQKNETFYGEVPGLPALRQALVNHYSAAYQAEITPENVLITSGTKHALFTLFSILLQPGDEVILPVPAWFGFTEILNLLQVKVVFLHTKPEDNHKISAKELESLITAKTRLFVYTNPGNPTGSIYSKSEIESWLQVLKKHPQIQIISDEIYDLIVYNGKKITSLLQFPDPLQKHIVVNGFSKNFGMSGWRIGYIIGPEKLIESCIEFQQTTISGVNPFIQEGALATLKQLPSFMPERIAALEKNCSRLCQFFDKFPEISYTRPEATYYLFADLRKLLQSEKMQRKGLGTAAGFCTFLEQELKILLQPGEKFQTPGFVRITFAVPENELQEAMQRLDTFLSES